MHEIWGITCEASTERLNLETTLFNVYVRTEVLFCCIRIRARCSTENNHVTTHIKRK